MLNNITLEGVSEESRSVEVTEVAECDTFCRWMACHANPRYVPIQYLTLAWAARRMQDHWHDIEVGECSTDMAIKEG